MGRKITDSVTWVGKVDWELKKISWRRLFNPQRIQLQRIFD